MNSTAKKNDAKKWGIVCPGHSLTRPETARAIVLGNNDKLVAINGAVLSPFQFDYWAMLDIEAFINVMTIVAESEAGKIFWLLDTVLWVPELWKTEIKSSFPRYYNIYKSFIVEAFKADTFTFRGELFPFGQTEIMKFWSNYTIFIAITLAVNAGAKVINVYGADMSGSGYYCSGLKNSRTRHCSARWIEELSIFNAMENGCRAIGVEVVRVSS